MPRSGTDRRVSDTPRRGSIPRPPNHFKPPHPHRTPIASREAAPHTTPFDMVHLPFTLPRRPLHLFCLISDVHSARHTARRPPHWVAGTRTPTSSHAANHPGPAAHGRNTRK